MTGQAYATSLAATDGTAPLSWTVQSGSLPPGLSLSTGGAITGDPTTQGTYSFVVEIIDAAGANDTQALSITVNTMPSNDTNVYRTTVTSVTPDTAPPTLTGLTVTPNTVDAGNSVKLSASVTDDLSGVLSATAVVSSPSGSASSTVPLTYNAATGNFEGLARLSEYAEDGTWTVTSVTLSDIAGNSIEITSGAEIASATFFVNSSLSDITPPSVTNLSISPSAVLAGESALVSASITDDISGVATASVSLESPSGIQAQNVSLTFNAATGLFEGIVRFSQFAENGTWQATRINLADTAGNSDEVTSGPVLNGVSVAVTSSTPDVTPPVLDAFLVSPASITAGDAVTFMALASDDISGVSTVTVVFTSPSGDISISTSLTFNAATTLFEGSLNTSQYAQSGNWAVTEVRLVDHAGNTKVVNAFDLQSITTLNPASYPPTSSNLTFTTTNPTGLSDSEPPTLLGVNIAPGTAAVGESVRVYVSASDTGSGLWYFQSAWLRSPSGARGWVSLYLNVATGFYEGNFTIAESAEPGEWAIASVTLNDNAGNWTTVPASSIALLPALDISAITSSASPNNMTFTVTNPSGSSDGEPPTLLGVNIAPGTAAVGESVRVYVSASDTGSGLGYFQSAWLRSPSGARGWVSLYLNVATGFYEGNFTIAVSAEPGEWAIASVTLNDNAGNWTTILASIIAPLPSLDLSAITSNASPNNMTFTVTNPTGPSDGEPPTLLGVNIAPGTATVGESVRIYVSATDTGSGLGYFQSAWLRSPSGARGWVSLYLNVATGFYEGNFTIAVSAEPGEWAIASVTLNDNAGNWTTITASAIFQLSPLDIASVLAPITKSTTVVVSSSQAPSTDVTPPTIISLAASPTTVNAGEQVWIMADATDDLSGVYSVSVTLKSPTDAYQVSTFLYHPTYFNPATGRLERGVTIPLVGEDGIWRVTSITLTDYAGNSSTINEIDPFLQANPVIVTVSNSQAPPPPSTDVTPPTIVSIAASPTTVNAGAQVWIMADATDDLSGVYSVSVTLKSSTDAYQVSTFLYHPTYFNPATGRLERGVTIPLVGEDGTWRVTSITLTDYAGNSSTINEIDPFLQSNPVTVTVSNSQVQVPSTDVTPPTISNIALMPSMVDAGQQVWVIAEVADDLSGVTYVSVTLKSPTDAYQTSASLSLNPATGRFERGATIPLVGEDGTWRVTRIIVTDNAGNSITINEGDPFLP